MLLCVEVGLVDYENHQGRKQLVRYSVLSFLLVFLLSFLVLFLIERQVRTARVAELKSQEQRVVNLENDFIGREFHMILSDLHYLNRAYQSELFERDDYRNIADNWTVFITQRGIYDQIRFIDTNGNEKIRINHGEDGGYVVPFQELQNKKDRYYFTETIQLNEDSVYVSPLDLNIEQGEVEVPYKPMMRISTPVYDEQGALQGMIVLNYLAEHMLSGFRDLASNSQGEMTLINADGYRLSSADPDCDWNFMFDEKKGDTFAEEYPDEWLSIIRNEAQTTTNEGLVTSASVALRQRFGSEERTGEHQQIVLGDGSWYIVSLFSRNSQNIGYFEDDLLNIAVHVIEKNVFYFLLIGIISAVIGFLIYVNRKTYSRIKYYSEFDPLTRTLNRRTGIMRLNDLFPKDEKRHFVVSLCFIDINGLKEVNDTLGHKYGDELIVSVADVIKETIRAQDFLVRVGGDEFLIVFNGIDSEKAEAIWQRIKEAYEKINLDDRRPYLISISHGIVDFDSKHKTHVDDLINAADEKMYNEKKIMKTGLTVIKENAVH